MNNKYPRTFLRYYGGKSKNLNVIAPYYPKSFDLYTEPMCGSAAVFFNLCRLGRIKRAVLNDSNEDVINCFAAIRDDVDGLICLLKELFEEIEYREAFYYIIREFRNDSYIWNNFSNTLQAAITIFLNKTGFSGLYRFSRLGKFNVPFGFVSLKDFEAFYENLRVCNQFLQNTALVKTDFADAPMFNEDTFIYLDPPYLGSHSSYNGKNFTQDDHVRLSEYFKHSQYKILMSNVDNEFIKELYKDYKIIELTTQKWFKSNRPDKSFKELLIMNYEV